MRPLLCLAALALVLALVGCGGSSTTTTESTSVASSPQTTTGSSHHRHHAPAPAAHAKAKKSEASSPKKAAKETTTKKKKKAPKAAKKTTPAPTTKTTKVTKAPTPAPSHHHLDRATAEKVAVAHPGVRCPSGSSRAECEKAVEAALTAPTSSTSATASSPAECTKVMSEVQCEELFAAEEAARENGGPGVSAQQCMAEPELPACSALVEEMEKQYEAAHPGG